MQDIARVAVQHGSISKGYVLTFQLFSPNLSQTPPMEPFSIWTSDSLEEERSKGGGYTYAPAFLPHTHAQSSKVDDASSNGHILVSQSSPVWGSDTFLYSLSGDQSRWQIIWSHSDECVRVLKQSLAQSAVSPLSHRHTHSLWARSYRHTHRKDRFK